MSKVLVNVRSSVNKKKIRKEKRNGRDVIIVPSATLPDDVVMNETLYPADEIAKSYKSLERTPAPLGHPTINGKFVPASDPEGINIGWIGAWNENVRRKDGRVFLDKIIDVARANESEGGKAVLAAIEKGDPIHTSTGLYCMMEEANGPVEYKRIAREIEFDHDAILLSEEGAATPKQGVGMLVNSKGEQEEIEVVNVDLDVFDHEIDWAGTRLIEAVRRKEDASKWQDLKSLILEALGFKANEREPSANTKEADMSKEELDALSKKVDTLSETVNAIPKTIADAVANAVKPLVDAHAEMVANQKAKDEAEKAELVAKVVANKTLDEAEAKETPLNVLRKLAAKNETQEEKRAFGLNGAAFKPTGEKPKYKAPAAAGAK